MMRNRRRAADKNCPLIGGKTGKKSGIKNLKKLVQICDSLGQEISNLRTWLLWLTLFYDKRKITYILIIKKRV